jgi:hypothetical protein
VILGRFVVTFVSSLDRQEDEIVRFVNLWRRSVAKFKRTLTSASVPAALFSLQSVTERFRRLPCLFIADMGIAHGRADILVAEQPGFPMWRSFLRCFRYLRYCSSLTFSNQSTTFPSNCS